MLNTYSILNTRFFELAGPALILETSGTTGVPQFHETLHSRLAEILKRDVEAMEIGPLDRLLTFCPLNHGLGLYAVLAQLWVGGGVILPHEFSRGELIAGLNRQPTWMVVVPPLLRAIYDARKVLKRPFSGVRFIRTGGAPLDPALEAAFEEEYGVPVLNGYGCTEIPCITRNTLRQRRAGSVGKTVPGARVMIDSNQEGAVGAILARDGKDWYDTGDRGHLDEDGYLFIDQARKSDVRNKTWKEKAVTC